MKRRWFVLTAILAMAAAVTVFLTNQVTQAQRPDRGERRDRAGGERRGGGWNAWIHESHFNY